MQSVGITESENLQPKKNNLKQLNVYVPRDYSENLKEALFSAGAGNIGFYDECSFIPKEKEHFDLMKVQTRFRDKKYS